MNQIRVMRNPQYYYLNRQCKGIGDVLAPLPTLTPGPVFSQNTGFVPPSVQAAQAASQVKTAADYSQWLQLAQQGVQMAVDVVKNIQQKKAAQQYNSTGINPAAYYQAQANAAAQAKAVQDAKAKDNTMLYVGLGAVALVLIMKNKRK